MNALLIKLLNMSAAGSVLILAVVVLRALLKKAPRWIICAMWALVAIRLICPISISSPVSAFRATPSIVSESGEVEVFRPAGGSEKPLLAVDTVQIERPRASSEMIREIPGTSYAVTQRSRNAYLPPLVQAYLLGLTAMLLYAMVSTLLLRRKVSVSMRQRGNIRVCDEVASPFILGILRPVIYLPSSLSEEEKRFVLAHERAHLRRLDHIWKPLGFLILSVHWFNPFCWLAYVLLCRDIELACDEKVIRELGRAERAAYSQTLLNCSAHRILAACPVAFGETDVKTRVKAVLNYKKPAFWIILAAVLGSTVLIVCFAANPVGSQKSEPTLPPMQETALPTPELPPEGPGFPENTSALVPADPLAFLLSFSHAQVVTVIDETGRSYENTGRSFAEIVSVQTWSAHQTEGFPASYPDRLIAMIHGDWELRIEEAAGECLYMVFPKDSDASSLVTYLDCGKNLMDELMPWATYEAGKPMGSGLTADDEIRIEMMFSELADAAQAGSSSLPSLTRWADRDPGGVVRLCELIGLYAESHRLDSGQIETLLPLIHDLDGANAEAFAALLAKLHRLYPAPFDIALARYADQSGDNRPNDLLRFAEPGFSLDQELVVFRQIYTNLASVVHMQWGEQYEQIAPRVADMQLYFCSSKLPDDAVWIVNGASPAWAVNIPLERGMAAVFFAEDGVPVALWPGANERPKLSVTSGNITVEPYPITRFSETWTENGQLSADALPIESELEAHKDEIPVLRLDGELQVRMPENTITLVFYLLDGKTGEQLKSETLYNETRQQSSIIFSVSQLDGLAPGRYLCCFYFVQACIVTETEGLFDRLGDNCYFWLEIPER